MHASLLFTPLLLLTASAALLPRSTDFPRKSALKGDVRLLSDFNPLDETPGSGGSWTAIFDNDDPRTLPELFAELDLDPSELRYVYNNTQFKGFAGELSAHCVHKMSNASSLQLFEPEVEIAVADTQVNAPWGLQRLSQGAPLPASASSRVADPSFKYRYPGKHTSLGAGVDVYIVDTGINTAHVDFQGRAVTGWSFDGERGDPNGHGTHCAGTAAGLVFGVAKAANVIGVRVLSADGGGSGDIIAGLEYVLKRHERRKNAPDFRGSVVSLSIGTPVRSAVFDNAVERVSAAGIHVSVAAGNENQSTCNESPAGVAATSNVISVGATDINDRRASFSNFGKCTSVYAPGVHIMSTWNEGDRSYNTISGTSMACPHVTGLIAYYLNVRPDLKTDTLGMKKLIGEMTRRIKIDKGEIRMVNNGFYDIAKRSLFRFKRE